MTEADWEQLVLDQLGELEWQPKHGKELAPGSTERESWADIILHGTLSQKLRDLNPGVPEEYLQQAKAEVLAPQSQDALAENKRLHDILIRGYAGITYVDDEGREQSPTIHFMAHGDVSKNAYLAVQQVTIRSRERERRFDVVLYVNGLPLVIVELKQAAAKNATVEGAYNQLQTYLREFPMAFRFCAFVVASDGISAKYGTPWTPYNHFAPWNVDDEGHLMEFGETDLDGEATTELDLTLTGLFNIDRFGQIMRDFIAFDQSEEGLGKRIAKPHQYFAVTKAVASTINAVDSDGRAGVVWHTQGSGKSMEMELYTAKVMRHQRLAPLPASLRIAQRIQLQGHPGNTQLLQQQIRKGDQFHIGRRLSRPNHLGINLVKLPITPLLRPLVPKQRPRSHQLQRRKLLPPFRDIGPAYPRRELRPQRQRFAVAVLERVHFLRNHVRRLAQRPRKHAGEFHHRHLHALEAEAPPDIAERLHHMLEPRRLISQEILHAPHGLRLRRLLLLHIAHGVRA